MFVYSVYAVWMNFTNGHARERVGTPRKGPLGNLSVPTTLKMNNFILNSNFDSNSNSNSNANPDSNRLQLDA